MRSPVSAKVPIGGIPMARRISSSQFRSQVRQLQSKLRQAANKQKQAIDRYNREVRAHNQRVRANQQKRKRAIDDHNRAVRNHNAKVRSNRQNLEEELRKLKRLASSPPQRVTVSAQRVHTAFVRVEQRRAAGAVYPEELYALFEGEAGNSLRAANAIDGGEAAEAAEVQTLQATSLGGELEAFSPDLARRWGGALFALNPQNPDAARHFCTSARECIVTALDIAAPDDLVKRELESCEYTDDGRLKRRSKLKYLLVRKGVIDSTVEDFVNADVEDILRLFRVFNDGTHGAAGRFDMNDLVVVKQRAESGIRFLYELWH